MADNTPRFAVQIGEWSDDDAQDFIDLWDEVNSMGPVESRNVETAKLNYIYDAITLDEFEDALETIFEGGTPDLVVEQARETPDYRKHNNSPILY